MSNKSVILVIDDEVQMQRLLQLTLEANGIEVVIAATGEEGLQKASMARPELIILDLGLPDMDGTMVLKKLREWTSVPVLILSVRNTEEDITGCLDSGADDYLVKPFRPKELLARVRTALRHRPSVQQEELFEHGNLFVDLVAREVKIEGEIVKLTKTEFNLLALFIRNAGKVLTHRYILEQIWGPTFAEETQYTRIYTAQLRKKIEPNPASPQFIVTESGIGYRFVVG